MSLQGVFHLRKCPWTVQEGCVCDQLPSLRTHWGNIESYNLCLLLPLLCCHLHLPSSCDQVLWQWREKRNLIIHTQFRQQSHEGLELGRSELNTKVRKFKAQYQGSTLARWGNSNSEIRPLITLWHSVSMSARKVINDMCLFLLLSKRKPDQRLLLTHN